MEDDDRLHNEQSVKLAGEFARLQSTVSKWFRWIIWIGIFVILATSAGLLAVAIWPNLELMQRIAIVTVLQTTLAIFFSAGCSLVGAMMTWLGISAAYQISVRGMSLASTSPGLVFAIAGTVLLGFTIYKPIGYREDGIVTSTSNGVQRQYGPTERNEDETPRQFYEEIKYDEQHGEWIYEWSFKPGVENSTYHRQYVVIRQEDPQHAYYLNPISRMFWGRYDYHRKGYSVLPQEKRVGDLDALAFGVFPSPGDMPDLPESTDGTKMEAPPMPFAKPLP